MNHERPIIELPPTEIIAPKPPERWFACAKGDETTFFRLGDVEKFVVARRDDESRVLTIVFRNGNRVDIGWGKDTLPSDSRAGANDRQAWFVDWLVRPPINNNPYELRDIE